MANKKTTKKVAVVKPQEDPPPKCPQGFVWSPKYNKCVADVG